MAANGDQDVLFTLPPTSEFLSACPTFRLLILGNAESTKHDLLSDIFGVELPKHDLSSAFSPTHSISTPLDISAQNPRLAVHTAANFGTGDPAALSAAQDFLSSHASAESPADRVHCIWYCVASDPARPVDPLETAFFADLHHIPTVLVFTKADELSQPQATQVRRRWDDVAPSTVPRVPVAGHQSLAALAQTTVSTLRDPDARLAFAAAQRIATGITAQFYSHTAAGYFTASTAHARKRSGVPVTAILADFFGRCARLANVRDPAGLLANPDLPRRVLDAALDEREVGLLGSEALVERLTPHDRAVLLAQGIVGIAGFWGRVEDGDDGAKGVTRAVVERALGGDLREGVKVVEGSRVFTECCSVGEVEEMVVEAVAKARGKGRTALEEDEAEKELALEWMNDRGGGGS